MGLKSGCIDNTSEEISYKGAESCGTVGRVYKPKRKLLYFSYDGRSNSTSACCRNDLEAYCINQFSLPYAALTNIPKMSRTCDERGLFLSNVICSKGICFSSSPSPLSRTQPEGADTFLMLWQSGRKKHGRADSVLS